MPVKVLIIDDVAANRIVLKVKIAAASYEVFQAGSATEALDIAQRETPDIFVVSTELDGQCSTDLIRTLCAAPDHIPANVIALSERACPQTRVKFMQAGVLDVLTKPLCEELFLARLRSVSRHRHEREDLALTSDTADALGFDEAARPFAARGRVRALDPGTDTDRSMLQAMVAHTRHNFGFCASGAKGDVAVEKGEPDVMLVVIADDENEAGLTQLAELRLADTTRHARLIAVLNDPGTALAGRALDVGADDVMGRAALPEEVDIRINTQLHSKQDEDGLRRRLQNSIEAAITDPLTGLYNRRYALSALGRLIETVTRDGGTLAVMVADLDHFKLVNDTYGHSAGDIALKCVADQLRDTLGSGAIVSRLGGEEFLIVLPKADSHAARLAADLLRLKVRDTDIFVPGRNEPIHVTISIGVTVAQASGRDARPSVEVLLGEADQALYHSKSDGRDTVRFNHSSAA